MTETDLPSSSSTTTEGLTPSFAPALVVDLDGTLARTDLLYESYFASITRGFDHHRKVLFSIEREGIFESLSREDRRSRLCDLAVQFQCSGSHTVAKAEGRKVYLATASDRHHAEGIAQSLGLFDGVFASDGATNLSGDTKARILVDSFGEGNFDYVADHKVDLPIWAHARMIYVLSNSASLIRKANGLGKPVHSIQKPRPSFRTWRKALRVHQYSKNALVFVPLVTAHAYTLHSFLAALLAFISFSLCASSVYLLNDLVDLNDDRRHPTKSKRPFAAGTIPISHGILAIPLLLVCAFACASTVSLTLAAALAAYFFLTLTYSLSLKRKLIVDVVVLATLYTVRVIAGAVAISVAPSEWSLAFSMLVFTCLALVKRYVELAMRIDRDLPDPSNRNYRLMDLPIVGALAAASGFNAVTIFALYVSSPAVVGLYRRPELLWMVCPVLLYWLSRIVVLAHRRVIDDDPIVFALRDRNSLLAGAAMIAIIFVAS